MAKSLGFLSSGKNVIEFYTHRFKDLDSMLAFAA